MMREIKGADLKNFLNLIKHNIADIEISNVNGYMRSIRDLIKDEPLLKEAFLNLLERAYATECLIPDRAVLYPQILVNIPGFTEAVQNENWTGIVQIIGRKLNISRIQATAYFKKHKQLFIDFTKVLMEERSKHNQAHINLGDQKK